MKKQTILMLAAVDLFALKINEKPIKSVHQALKMHTTIKLYGQEQPPGH